MANSNIAKILTEYNEKRNREISDAIVRKNDIYLKCPRLQEIDDEVASVSIKVSIMLMENGETKNINSRSLKKRLDALETAIWILCIVVKLTFFIYIIVQSFSFSFKKINKHRKIFSAFMGGVIAVILIFFSGNIVRFSFVSSAAAAISVYVVPVIILPAILIGVNFIYDRRKNYEKN